MNLGDYELRQRAKLIAPPRLSVKGFLISARYCFADILQDLRYLFGRYGACLVLRHRPMGGHPDAGGSHSNVCLRCRMTIQWKAVAE